jgi:hypothetical protein
MDQLFSSKHQLVIKKKETAHFCFLLKEIKSELETDLSINPVFKKRIQIILKDRTLKEYSPLKFFWTHLIEDYFYLINTESEDALFEYWENSEYCNSFFKLMDQGISVSDASAKLLADIENQILSFYYLHLNTDLKKPPYSLKYKIISEIGDFNQRIYLRDNHFFINFKKPPRYLPFIAIKSISKKSLETNLGRHKINSPKPKIFNNSVSLLPTSNDGIKRSNEFKIRIEKALRIIKKYSPDSYKTFLNFTHTILPVNEPGVVSYSLQNLPGYSCINLFERDFIDLLDDLIHENGHHYLNCYLNFCEIINEDDEKIYYSPWRNSLRPIRGIYHACFTFFWALHLFGNLFKNLKKMDFLNKSEKEKIASRFIEESLMLNYCLPDLEHAYKNKKINKDGMKLIKMVYSQIKPFKKDLDLAFNFLEDKSKLVAFKLNLEEKRKKYALT